MSEAWAREYLGGEVASRSQIHCLRGDEVTRQAISDVLEQDICLLYFGHGSVDRLGETDALVDAENVDASAGGLIVAFACYSAQELGPEAVRRKVEAYVGFDDLLAVYSSPLRAIGPGVIELLDCLTDGGSVNEACEHLAQWLAGVVEEYAYGAQRRHPDAPTVFLTARLMQRSLLICGDGSYSLH